MTKVVADTGDFEMIKKFKPVDCTTNPSLVLKVINSSEYASMLGTAIEEQKQEVGLDALSPSSIADQLIVNIGCEILKIIPGRVSTEVDARLSYDTDATIQRARNIVRLYQKKGIDTSQRVYIKIASTWEGAKACEILEKEGVCCNMTLLFSFPQACACANAGASLISPFVGRILDWYKAKEGREFAPEEDPGVLAVQKIYNYYKHYGIKTIVMAASFRNIGEIQQLAGCDNITISPGLLGELEENTSPLPRILSPEKSNNNEQNMSHMGEALFRELHAQNEMAVEKLSQGIDAFAADQVKLEELIKSDKLFQTA
eukprot:TRINITY_DN2686_c2_g1_i1.p1 TRINITY_DN2686_c2_g1~~TRINITY_DN2686_c2_g1_i1.p1  ORF type:complete len:368 (-),score=43.40 TRINITY_DN2686_c2_g1_i1:349-1293(-)